MKANFHAEWLNLSTIKYIIFCAGCWPCCWVFIADIIAEWCAMADFALAVLLGTVPSEWPGWCGSLSRWIFVLIVKVEWHCVAVVTKTWWMSQSVRAVDLQRWTFIFSVVLGGCGALDVVSGWVSLGRSKSLYRVDIFSFPFHGQPCPFYIQCKLSRKFCSWMVQLTCFKNAWSNCIALLIKYSIFRAFKYYIIKIILFCWSTHRKVLVLLTVSVDLDCCPADLTSPLPFKPL